MSTRSGKRIHSSLHENDLKVDSEVLKSERKTRKRLKEKGDGDQIENTVSKLEKRENYVTYPTDEEFQNAKTPTEVTESKISRKLRRNTLKEHNVQVSENSESIVLQVDAKKVRLTRQSRKTQNTEEADNAQNNVCPEDTTNEKVKSKKNKKKKGKKLVSVGDKAEIVVTKKSKKKKQSNCIDNEFKNSLNKSNTSVESFHSAAGSPGQIKDECYVVIEKSPLIKELNTTKDINRKSRSSVDNEKSYAALEKSPKDKNFDKVRNNVVSKEECVVVIEKSPLMKILEMNTETIDNELQKPALDTTIDKETSKRRSSIKNATFDKIDNVASPRVSRRLNSTFDKTPDSDILNTTYENGLKTRRSSRVTEDLLKNPPDLLNTTFEKKTKKLSKTISHDSTFDKTDLKLTCAFDKTESLNKTSSTKSSLISSENTINVTFDKSSDNSRISITSDESKENIINTTPLLIESSMDESQINNSKNLSGTPECITSPKKTAKSLTPKENALPTPMKREGTFTKDGPDVIIMSPKPRISAEKTPTTSPKRRMSLPSPGSTPFPNRSSQKESRVLNVTRSIDKTGRLSLLADVQFDDDPKQTRVMFCSPVNNAAVVMQQKRKVIKSSLKGSNKSFIFDVTTSAPSPKPAARKRSLTLCDAQEALAKRKRLPDDMQLSVDRLSRPRTSSAAAKLESPKKGTAKAEKPRTKLPNFAALHQKEFAKMESLDECQRRRAQRARRLLTPNGKGAVQDTTRATTTDPPKPAKELKESLKLSLLKKPETKAPTLPTLESLRPGFTRFGFKMNCDANPFSIPSKTETKPKEIKPNGLRREPTLPSLNGATSLRREAAKQAAMREKSFTSFSNKRDASRKENRTIIKGVRTNRRFELQMKLRKLD